METMENTKFCIKCNMPYTLRIKEECREFKIHFKCKCSDCEKSLTIKEFLSLRENDPEINKKVFCENENCEFKDEAKFYCVECKKHLCQGDENLKHDSNHKIIKMDKYLEEETVAGLDSGYLQLRQAIEKNIENMDKYFMETQRQFFRFKSFKTNASNFLQLYDVLSNEIRENKNGENLTYKKNFVDLFFSSQLSKNIFSMDLVRDTINTLKGSSNELKFKYVEMAKRNLYDYEQQKLDKQREDEEREKEKEEKEKELNENEKEEDLGIIKREIALDNPEENEIPKKATIVRSKPPPKKLDTKYKSEEEQKINQLLMEQEMDGENKKKEPKARGIIKKKKHKKKDGTSSVSSFDLYNKKKKDKKVKKDIKETNIDILSEIESQKEDHKDEEEVDKSKEKEYLKDEQEANKS
ncbi:MAG: hypothetical protein MJ252_18865, partial [archaeon]|nr:hypothetical protein [archaeon]